MRIKTVNNNAIIPERQNINDAGYDLCSVKNVIVNPGETEMIGTGIAMEIPPGLAGFVFARSGLSTKKGLAPANKVGVIDSNYRGEIMVALHNHSSTAYEVKQGERIAQIVFLPIYLPELEIVEELTESERGENGFGSTGR